MKSHGIGGGPKNAFFGPPPRKFEKSLIFTGLFGHFESLEGDNRYEDKNGFKSLKSPVIYRVFGLVRRLEGDNRYEDKNGFKSLKNEKVARKWVYTTTS